MAAVALPDWLDFRRQRFPSCNFVWLRGSKPVLADTGFGSDLETTLAGLADRFRMPDRGVRHGRLARQRWRSRVIRLGLA